jgi:restriction endonuclease Mrr
MIPKFYEITHPLLKLIAKEEQTRKSASEKLSIILNLSEEDKQEKNTSGGYIFENRVGWAFTYLTKAEYIELTEQKAVYRINNLGLDALKDAEEKNVAVDKKYLEENSSNYFKNWQVKNRMLKQKSSQTMKKMMWFLIWKMSLIRLAMNLIFNYYRR